jgi:hypothetical protein
MAVLNRFRLDGGTAIVTGGIGTGSQLDWRKQV